MFHLYWKAVICVQVLLPWAFLLHYRYLLGSIAEIKTIVHLLAVAWKRALFTELVLSNKMKHTYIMAHPMESSSIGTTITQIHFGVKIMKTKTELLKHIWQLKRNGIEFDVKWSITAYATPCTCGTRRYDLCLTEKFIIAWANQNNVLNKRTELISKLQHINKHILKSTWYILNWFTMEQFKF